MKTVEAIYENGVLRPLQPVDVKEGTIVRIILPQAIVGAASADDSRTAAEIIAEIAAMPLENDEPFSGEDHDEVLYGWKKQK